MELSLNRTIDHLKRMMACMKDVVFPLYSDVEEEDAVCGIYENLKQVTSHDVADSFLKQIKEIRRLLDTDVKALAHNDPAVKSEQEIVWCYPAVTAMLYYRTAHALLEMGVPIIPRMLTEYAHNVTGIDIHPGATIGEGFAIDHGTGVVIGETSVIGKDVTLYQGVTLGAKSFRYGEDGRPMNLPRHPILEDGVTVYSNASILGRVTIGEGSVIGGNVWLTHSVPPRSRILQSRAQEHFADGAGI